MGADGRPRVIFNGTVCPVIALPESTGAATTAGTVTVQIHSYPVPLNRVQTLKVFLCAYSTSNNTGEGYERTVTVRRGPSGPAVVVGVGTPHTAEENNSANVTFTADGSGNLISSVVGAGVLNHKWTMVMSMVLEASP